MVALYAAVARIVEGGAIIVVVAGHLDELVVQEINVRIVGVERIIV